MTACSTVISVYTILIIIRILMSWLSAPYSHGKVGRLLARITDPYLEFFRRFKVFRIGTFDFSPVLALIILSVAGNVFLALAAFQQVTFGIVLALLISRIWAALAFFLGMYIFLVALRFVGLIARLNSASPFWRYVDMMLKPILQPVAKLVFRGRSVPFMNALVAAGLFLLALRFLGGFLINHIVIQIQKIPF